MKSPSPQELDFPKQARGSIFAVDGRTNGSFAVVRSQNRPHIFFQFGEFVTGAQCERAHDSSQSAKDPSSLWRRETGA